LDITTKELFELAEFYWKNGPELDDDSETERIDWEDLSHAWQAEEAESIQALLGELENRGWTRLTYPQKYIFGPSYSIQDIDLGDPWAIWREPAITLADEIPTEYHEGKWDRWEDVPVGVIVEGHGPHSTDDSADPPVHNKFRKREDGDIAFWYVDSSYPVPYHAPVPADGCAPFVKVEG